MNKIEFDENDSKWLEEQMKQESEKLEIPESLEPAKIAQRLKGERQQSAKGNWKKKAVAAASLLIVAGVSLQVGRMTVENQAYDDHTTSSSVQYSLTNEKDESLDTDSTAVENELIEESEELEGSSTSSSEDSVENQRQDLKDIYFCMQRGFTEGEGKSVVTNGTTIISGIEKEVVISEYASGKVNEISRTALNQEAKEFYLSGSTLTCISSDNDGTTVYTLDISDLSSPQTNATISVGGNLQCSYLEDNVLYVFTDTGTLQRIDLSNKQTNTFSVAETDAKYYMAGEAVYTLKEGDTGTTIQKYVLSNGSFQASESVLCETALDNIVAVEGDGNDLRILIAEEDGVTSQTYDNQMRLIQTKTNQLGEQVFAGEFTENGLLVLSYSNTNVMLQMLEEDTLETEKVTQLSMVSQIQMKNLELNPAKNWFGLIGKDISENTLQYYVYAFNEDTGFEEVKSATVGSASIGNDFIVEDSILIADTDGIEVLLE